MPALDDLVGTTSRGGPVTWVRLERVEDLVDVAAGLGDGRPHPGLAGSARRPVAHVRRLSPDWLLLVTPTAWYTEGDRQVSTARFACLLGPGTVLTAEEGAAGVHEAMLDRLRLLGPPHDGAERRVMSAAVLSIVAGAAEVELGLGDAVAETERIVFDDRHEDPVQRIYDLKREITEARRALLPVTTELPEALDPDDAPDHPAVNRRMLERVVTTIERIDRHLDAHDDLLSDMLSAHLSRVSVRQNEDMRKISAWAAILVYPTIVAGVYGMNFRHMPELGWLLGYPFAIALMTAGCVVLYRVFKRAGWL
ncbi:magnesium and cobalt transport protein CorA [Cellulosimicrobium terreum]|nr:magnesium and cobalt transport protein CorA [Cellulosimicrobium terreum]